VENVLNKLNEISINKSFQIYSNYYKTLNKIFNINYDNVNDINSLMNSSSSIKTITRIEMTYGGVGYTPFQEYIITIPGISPASAKVRALKDGSLSGEIYDLDGGSYSNLDDIDNINPTATPSPTAPAKFKAYKSNSITIGGVKEYSIAFKNVYENIKRNAGYIDNILEEDIEDHLNLIKKEEDLLRYIDVYDMKYDFLKNFLIITRNKNEELFDISLSINEITKINNDTYLIDLIKIEKYKPPEFYPKLIKYLDIKDLKSLEIANLNHKEDILKSLANFDKAFYYLIFIIIIILTIILHIFFVNL